MPNIRPISDLRDYNKVVSEVRYGEPVFLTKNGRGRYAVIDITEYENMTEELELYTKLLKGIESGENNGCIDWKEAKKMIGAKNE